MTAFSILGFYPLLATSMTVALVARRLGRRVGSGLLLYSIMLSLWVVCLIGLSHPDTASFAERYLPIGIMMAGPGVHAAAEIVPISKRAIVLAYLWGAFVAAAGMLIPSAYFEPGFMGPGPLFWPVAFLSAIGVCACGFWSFWHAFKSEGVVRRRQFAIGWGVLFSAIGSGAATAGAIFQISQLSWAAAPLLIAVLLLGYAILSGQFERRALLVQELVYGVMTAVIGAIGLTLFFRLLPYLAPSMSWGWIFVVSFWVALPLDQLRSWIVESLGRRVFRRPIGLSDLTEEIREVHTKIDHSAGLAEIGTMASAVAHELRNPLGVINAEAMLLERRGADPKSVERLREQVKRASHFVDDLLNYSKPRPLRLSHVSVAKKLAEIKKNCLVKHGDRGPTIEVRCEPASLEWVFDANAFSDVHETLFDNAIAAGATRILVSVDELGQSLRIRVEDNGPGVPAELSTKVFEPFVTGRGRDTQYPGTGLGLAIAKRWMERHEGTIQLDRSDESGAHFVLTWPKTRVTHG